MQPIRTSAIAAAHDHPPQDGTREARLDVGERAAVDVGNGGQLADAEREVAIEHAGREIDEHMRKFGETGDFGERGAADAARLRMEALIRGRSQQQVERMEQERGLRA